jgi:arabinose-5-phosphate isomerase
MGTFTKNDIVVAVSKSGTTEELLIFIRTLESRGFHSVVAVTSNETSELATLAKLSIVISVNNEGDYFGDIVPLASTISYEGVLQAIAVQIAYDKRFTKEAFLKNHPGGSIGRLARKTR